MGPVSFHSWRGWETETLMQWAQVAQRMGLPLFVGEGCTTNYAHGLAEDCGSPSTVRNRQQTRYGGRRPYCRHRRPGPVHARCRGLHLALRYAVFFSCNNGCVDEQRAAGESTSLCCEDQRCALSFPRSRPTEKRLHCSCTDEVNQARLG